MAGRTDLEQLVYEMDVNISKLIKNQDKAIAAANGGATRIEKRYGQMAANSNAALGRIDLGRALDKVVDSTRLKVLDSATARVGLYGSAIEALGVAALPTAAAIGGLGFALAEAHGAAKFADEIQDAAKRLHVTTDALQEFRYANFEAGGAMQGADEALEGFNEILGKAEENAPKALKQFKALFGESFTAEDARRLEESGNAIDVVVEKIANLKSDAQKDALIEALGLKGMKPLILEGVQAMEQLRARAHEIGIVMDADLIQRGAEANKQFEVLTKVVDVELKSAFIDLAPVMLGLLKFAKELAGEILAIADQLRTIEHRSTTGLVRQRAQALDDIAAQSNPNLASRVLGNLMTGGQDAQYRAALIARDRDKIAAIDAELRSRGTLTPEAIPHGTAVATLPGRSSTRRAPTDRSAQVLDDLARQQAEAQKALVADLLAWAKTYDPTNLTQIDELIDQQAAAERAALEAALKKQEADLKAAARKGEISGQVLQQALIAAEQTSADKAKLLDSKTAAEHQKAAADAAKVALDQAEQLQQIYNGIASDQASMAASIAERRAIELRILKLDQQLEQKKLDQARAADPLADTTHKSHWDAVQAATNDKFASETRKTLQDTAGPLEQYANGLRSINDQIQQAGVDAFKGLADGMADAIVNAKNLGEVASNVFKQLLAQILSAALQKYAFAPFMAAIGLKGFAGGTDFAPGGLSLVGEKGPELVNLPRGAQVIPNDVTRGLAGLGASRGGNVVYVSIAANDAVIASDLYSHIDASLRKAMTYTDHATAYGFRLQRSESARAAGNRLG